MAALRIFRCVSSVLRPLAMAGLLTLLCGCGAPAHIRSSDSMAPKQAQRVLYVATNGDDRWSGGRPVFNRRKTDGPFASLAGALTAVRREKGKGSVTVFIRGGTYFLREPLALTPDDSGLTFAAYRDEKPVISGGRRIVGRKSPSEERTCGPWTFPRCAKGNGSSINSGSMAGGPSAPGIRTAAT